MKYLDRLVEILKSEQAIRLLISRILIKTNLCLLFKIKREGYRVFFSPSNMCFSMFMQGKKFFEAQEKFITSLLEEGDVVIDAGANIGCLAIAAKLKVKNSDVYAFEPHPKTFSFLESNVNLNNLNILTHNVALSDHKSELYFTDFHADDCNQVSSSELGVTVKSDLIDNIVKNDNVKLFKIDIEGYEIFALKGAINTLEKTDFLIFELWQNHCKKFNYQAEEIISLLTDLKFNIFKIENDFSKLRLLSDNEDYSVIGDYLALSSAANKSLISAYLH